MNDSIEAAIRANIASYRERGVLKRRQFVMSDRAMTFALAAARTDHALYAVLRRQADLADWYSDDGRLLTDELDNLIQETTR